MTTSNFAITEQEKINGKLSEATLEQIKSKFETVGFAVVEGLVPIDVQQLLMDAFLEDVAMVREKPGLTPHEKHTAEGHLQLGPRRCAPFVRSEFRSPRKTSR